MSLIRYKDPAMAGKSRYFKMGRVPLEVRYDAGGSASVHAFNPAFPNLQDSLRYIGEFNRDGSDDDELTAEQFAEFLKEAQERFTPELIASLRRNLAGVQALLEQENP